MFAVFRERMSPPETNAQARSTADAVARRSYGKLVAFLAARTRDVAAAEDALSEAFASALADWPRNGCPSNPEAWLLTVARRKAIDMHRGLRRHELAADELHVMAEGLEAAASVAEIPDQRLALMFACAHPAIDAGIRAPLILQVILGLDAKAIASAFLMSSAAMGKRLVRAKDKIRQAGIPFRVPEREELPARLDTVLDAVYAAFAEGWTDPGGTDVVRRDLTEEAFFLARIATELLPDEPEALGLLAFMLHAEARRRARRNRNGDYVPLAEQDSALWDSQMIFEAEELLRRAGALGLTQYQTWPRTRGSPNTNPTGQPARNFYPRPAHGTKPTAPMRWPSASSATTPSAASCNDVNRHWHVNRSHRQGRSPSVMGSDRASRFGHRIPFFEVCAVRGRSIHHRDGGLWRGHIVARWPGAPSPAFVFVNEYIQVPSPKAGATNSSHLKEAPRCDPFFLWLSSVSSSLPPQLNQRKRPPDSTIRATVSWTTPLIRAIKQNSRRSSSSAMVWARSITRSLAANVTKVLSRARRHR